MFKFSFFQSKLCFAYLRLIRPNQLETTFTGKKSILNVFLVFAYEANDWVMIKFSFYFI